MDKRERFVTSVTCPECALNGSATWEENESGNLETTIKSLSHGFTVGPDNEIVCTDCGVRHALSASPPVRSLPIPRLLGDTCGTLLQFWNISCAVAVGAEADMAETGRKTSASPPPRPRCAIVNLRSWAWLLAIDSSRQRRKKLRNPTGD
jgi:hypothetical protein